MFGCGCNERLIEIQHELNKIREEVLRGQHRIYNLVNNRFPIMHIQFINFTSSSIEKGILDMDLQLVNSPTAGALGTPVETKADGTPFTFDPTQIKWSVQDSTVVSFVQNSDGTAQFKAVGVGTTQVGVVDVATNASKTVTATVTPGVQPNTMDITFSSITT